MRKKTICPYCACKYLDVFIKPKNGENRGTERLKYKRTNNEKLNWKYTRHIVACMHSLILCTNSALNVHDFVATPLSTHEHMNAERNEIMQIDTFTFLIRSRSRSRSPTSYTYTYTKTTLHVPTIWWWELLVLLPFFVQRAFFSVLMCALICNRAHKTAGDANILCTFAKCHWPIHPSAWAFARRIKYKLPHT